MKRVTCFIGIVVIAFALIAFSSTNFTLASDESGDKCEFCGKPNDSHGGAINVEQDGETKTFCCKGCVNKYEKEHHDKSQGKDDHPGKHKWDDKH